MAPTRRRPWASGIVAAILVVAALAVAQAGFVNNARVTRLHHAGIYVSARILGCEGNIGGSGSTSAGYTCRGAYAYAGEHFSERIDGTFSFLSTGSHVAVVMDPAHHNEVILASALAPMRMTLVPYVIPVLLVLGAAALVILPRRRRD
jgi:hypothetical protein